LARQIVHTKILFAESNYFFRYKSATPTVKPAKIPIFGASRPKPGRAPTSKRKRLLIL